MDDERTEDPSRGDKKATSDSSFRGGGACDMIDWSDIARSLALVKRSDREPHRKRNLLLETRDEQLKERLEACAQVCLRFFVRGCGRRTGRDTKSHTQHIVAFLMGIPDVLFNKRAVKTVVQNGLASFFLYCNCLPQIPTHTRFACTRICLY